MVLWDLRKEDDDEEIDLEASYALFPTRFSILLHYGGVFTKFPGRKYIKGKKQYVDNIDIDKFSCHEIDAIIEKLGQAEDEKPIYYHFKRPGWDLDFGMYALASDADINHLRCYVAKNKLVEVYTEYWETKLHTYDMYSSPANIRIEEIPEPAPRAPLYLKWKNTNTCEGSKKQNPVLLNERIVDQCPSTLNGTTESVPNMTVNPNTGEGSSQQNHIPLNDTIVEQPPVPLNDTIVEQPPVPLNDTIVNPTSEPQASQSSSVYRPRMGSPVVESYSEFPGEMDMNFNDWNDDLGWADGLETPSKRRCQTVEIQGSGDESGEEIQGSGDECGEEGDTESGSSGDDSQDSDFFVDEDNMLEDPEVDMQDFMCNIDKDVEWCASNQVIADQDLVPDEEVEVIDTEVFISGSSDEGETEASKKRKKHRDVERAMRNEAAAVKDPFWKGQRFSSPKEAKQAIYLHSIESRRELDIVKNDKNRIRVHCRGTLVNVGILETGGTSKSKEKGGPSQKNRKVKEGCPWVLLVSKWKRDEDWTVKTYKREHKCLQTRKIKACNYKFLAQSIQDQLQSNPEIPIRALREQLERTLGLGLSDMKVHRAKSRALDTIRGDFAGQYAVLRDYLEELQARNPNTTVKIDVESEPNISSETRVFKRVYICLGALKSGFAAGKRDLLGLDGCFMKGPYPGYVLTAVGLDGNNCCYTLAYAIVEGENYSSWHWFLTILGDDLELYRNSNFTFISDRQKGLQHAVENLFPAAEHRYCLRHIHENMKKQWRGKPFKDALWKCATTTTVPQFNHAMEDLKNLNQETYNWVKAIPPKHWARSHFSVRPHCDILLNNICESLNSKIVKGRDKPIITCLEFIREYIMRKLVIVQRAIDKADGPLTPTATKTLEKIKTDAADCRVIFCGNNKYQVTGLGMDQCIVDMGAQTCSCKKWELTGMPCKHSIAAIWNMRLNNEAIGVPETWVHPTYWLSTWKEMYVFKLEPINGRFMWEKSACPTKLLPPLHHVPVGRPKKKRRRSATEDIDRETRRVTCSKCGNVGHNARDCRGQRGGPSQASGVSQTTQTTSQSQASAAGGSARGGTGRRTGGGSARGGGKKGGGKKDKGKALAV